MLIVEKRYIPLPKTCTLLELVGSETNKFPILSYPSLVPVPSSATDDLWKVSVSKAPAVSDKKSLSVVPPASAYYEAGRRFSIRCVCLFIIF